MLEVMVCTVLYIEDDADDTFLFKRAFSHSAIPCHLQCVDSFAQARSYMLGEHPYSDRLKCPLPHLIMTPLCLLKFPL